MRRREMMLGLGALAAGWRTPAEAQSATGLSGQMILGHRDGESGPNRVARLDLATGRVAIELDGYGPRVAAGQIIFFQKCGARGLGARAAVADQDGFTKPIGPCDRNTILSNLHNAAPSADLKRFAVVDEKIEARSGDWRARARAGSRRGVLVQQAEGDQLGVLIGFDAPAWTRSGDLLMAGDGRAEGAPYGIYRAAPDFSRADRIDDGRLNNRISSIVVAPSDDRVAFIYNGQIWEMRLSDGAPKRRLAYERPIAVVGYAPDGEKLAFIVENTLRERLQRNAGSYFVHVLDGGTVIDLPVRFKPFGPISWIPG